MRPPITDDDPAPTPERWMLVVFGCWVAVGVAIYIIINWRS